MSSPLVVWFQDIDTHPTSKTGKAGKHLGNLSQAGFPLLPGFLITSDAYFSFLQQNHLETKIKNMLTTVNYDLPESLHQVSEHLKDMVWDTPFPDELIDELERFYEKFGNFRVRVQGHDGHTLGHKIASYHADDFEELLDAIQAVWIDHFEPNMHWKRHEHGHDHIKSGIEIVVQIEAKPEKKGKVFTIDPHEHTKNIVTITHDHTHTQDTYILSKKNLTILDRKLNHHNNAAKLDHDELLDIADLAAAVEKHLYFPQEISWGIIDDEVYLLATKHLSTVPKKKVEHKKKLAHIRGVSLNPTIGSGIVRIIADEKDLDKTSSHDIIVVQELQKRHLSKIKKARGIVSEKGEKHSELSVLIRQMGIPTLIDVKGATKKLKHGTTITIHGPNAEIYIGGHH